MEGSDNGNQKGRHNSGQNNYHTIVFFLKKKWLLWSLSKKKIVFILTALVLKGHI